MDDYIYSAYDDPQSVLPMDSGYSTTFNSVDADVVFKSSDYVLFGIHRKNLESCTGGLLPSVFNRHGEAVKLPERSSTLELLFQYIYPIPQPQIHDAQFEIIAAVAAAAEKYQVYPAIYICTFLMEIHIDRGSYDAYLPKSYGSAVRSAKFDSTDADVIFRSCDDVLFKIHRKNLESCTSGFPPSSFQTLGEIIPLTEHSSILELLFQYIYPVPQPRIRSLPFVTKVALADAAEKYQVYPAIPICTILLEMMLPHEPLKIFAHAGQHGRKDILRKAAPHLIGTPLDKVVDEIPGHLVIPWIKYSTVWESQLQEARSYPYKDGLLAFSKLRDIYHRNIIMDCMVNLKDIHALKDLTRVFGEPDYDDENPLPTFLRQWRTCIEWDIGGMKPFDTYLV